MRVLYLNPDPGVPVLGRKGCSTHVREVCRALAGRGHEVLCLTAATVDPSEGAGESPPDADLGFEIHELPAIRWKWMGMDARRLLYNLRLRRHLSRLAADFEPDLIYERYALYATAGSHFAGRHGIPHMLEVNTFLAREQAHRMHLPRLAHRYEEQIWRTAEALVAVSTPLGEELRAQKLVRGPLRVMPMAVSPDRFRPNLEWPVDFDPRGFLAEGWFTAIYAGALTAWHGIETFFAVGRLWREAGDRIRLVAIGGDSLQTADCRRRAAAEGLGDHLVFVGSVPYGAVPAYLAHSQAGFIAETSRFSSPTKLFEYMASGLPTVAPELPAIREVLDDEATGLIYPAEQPEAAAAAMRRLAADPPLRDRLGAQARARVIERHSWDRVAQEIEQLHAELPSARLRAAGQGGAATPESKEVRD